MKTLRWISQILALKRRRAKQQNFDEIFFLVKHVAQT